MNGFDRSIILTLIVSIDLEFAKGLLDHMKYVFDIIRIIKVSGTYRGRIYARQYRKRVHLAIHRK